MSKETFADDLKVIDNHGFVYEVRVIHFPEIGISFASYKGEKIDRFEYGPYRQPTSDDDQEWEEYEERFREGIGGEAMAHFELSLKDFFNQTNS